MAEIVIPAENWTKALAQAIEQANEGDVIVVATNAMKQLGKNAKKRMRPHANISFVVRVPILDEGLDSLPEPPCDKCGTPVPPANDATFVQAIKNHEPLIVLVAEPRHFLPIPGVCEGSPSRAQYIEGQPRDKRYPYHPEDEKAWRDAYAEVQRHYGHNRQ
jgi:hypothetical protein